jgi:hypothetical protein
MSDKQLEKKTLIGPKKNPVAMIYRKDLEAYVDASMWNLYKIWSMWKKGFGLPLSGTWAEQPIWIIDIINLLENEHRKMEA